MLLVLVAASFAAAPPPIINGEDASEADYPMTGGLVMSARYDLGSQGKYTLTTLDCSSTLIAPDVVIVAAHCLDPVILSQGTDGISEQEYGWSRQADLSKWDGSRMITSFPDDAVMATEWDFHQKWNAYGLGYGIAENFDIGIVFLEAAVLDVTPAVLVTADEADQLEEGVEVEIVGWGLQQQTDAWSPPEDGTYAFKQMATTVIGEIGEPEFQVGVTKEDGRKCHGDSGGPTFMHVDTDSAQTLRQIGITSHAYDATDCEKKGGVDTRIDHYLEWIDNEMTERCEDGSRIWCEVPGILPPPAAAIADEDTGADDEELAAAGCACDAGTGQAPAGLAAVAFLAATRRKR